MFENKLLKFYKTFQNANSTFFSNKSSSLIYLQKRQIVFFFEWLTKIFNRVDTERLKLVGPDCTCAEWLLKNGASVRFKGHHNFLSDYNALINLEKLDSSILKVEDIHAEKVVLSSLGFEHLKNCNHVKKITLIFCAQLTDSSLMKLKYVKDTLQFLEVTSCLNIRDKGLYAICELSNLKTLILADLVSVENKDACEVALRKALPKCKIDFKK